MRDVALTTVDNPYNPFTDFDNWYKFDERNGYHSCSYLSRMCVVPVSFTDSEATNAIESAIDEIVKFDPLERYIKLVKTNDNDDERINKTIKLLNEYYSKQEKGNVGIEDKDK